MDYFLARYYSASQGRFLSPDEFTGGPDEFYDFADLASDNPTFYADLTDPQSLNKYQYAYNSPLLYVDPDGHQGIREFSKKVAETGIDFIDGVKKGVNSSITFGAIDAPSENDTITNRLGQLVGTALTGGVGQGLTGGGVAISGSGVGVLVGAPAAVVGVEMMVGAVVNGYRVITTPIKDSSAHEARSAGANIPKPKPGSAGGPGAGKAFSDKVKGEARAMSSNKCAFCGVKTTKKSGPRKSNIDHAIPKSRGGNNTINNAQNTCRTCNLQKSDRTTKEFLKIRKKRNAS